MRLRSAPLRGGFGVIGDARTGRSSVLDYVVQRDLLDPTVTPVVIQRSDRPSIAAGLRLTNVVDLPQLVAAGIPAYVDSIDPDVRMVAISAASQASIDSGRDVSLIVDDAEDVTEYLARLLHSNDAPRTHISAAWAPRDNRWHTGLWLQLTVRFQGRIEDEVVARTYSYAFTTTLRDWTRRR